MTQPESNGEQGQDAGPTNDQPSQMRLEIPYIRSTLAPVLHIDGVFGGFTTKGLLYLAFFSEHTSIPDVATINIDMANKTGREQPVQGLNVREVGAEIIMDLDLARTIRDWLTAHIDRFEQRGPDTLISLIPPEQQT